MPALSPTMTQGNIAKWKVSEGGVVRAGDSMAGTHFLPFNIKFVSRTTLTLSFQKKDVDQDFKICFYKARKYASPFKPALDGPCCLFVLPCNFSNFSGVWVRVH